MIKVDKGVPMPAAHGKSIYPWHDLEVGDSFVINVTSSNPSPPPKLIEKGLRFKKYIVTEGGKKVGRIWRTK